MSASPPAEPAQVMDQATVAVDAGDVPANGLTTASGDSDIDLSDDEAPARPRLAFPKAPVAETADVNAPADEVASAVGDDAADQMDQPTEATAEDAALAEPTGGGLLDDSASDDSDGDRIPRYKKKSKSKKRAASDEGSGRDDDDDDDDDDFNEGDAEAKKRRKAEKRRKKDRAARAGKRGRDELGDEEMRMLDEGDAQEEVIDEETRRRMARESKIDAIGKVKKQVRRRKKGEEDIMDSAYEDMCVELRKRMTTAQEQDVASRLRGEPAMAKLSMLDEVMSVLRNQTMWQAIVDSQILETVRLWLEPQTNDRSFYETGEHSEPVPGSGPRWSLPAVGIQRAFFEVLPKMDLDAPTLKESKLGPIVLFYTKTKRCPVEVRRQAEELVQIWSRPIAKRPVDFRQRRVQHARPTIGGVEGGGDMEGEGEGEGEDGEGDDGYEGSQSQRNGGGRASASQSQGAGGQRIIKKVFDARTAVEENRGRKGARLPVVKAAQYTVVPESRTSHQGSSQEHVSRLQQDNRKFNKFARSLKMAGKR